MIDVQYLHKHYGHYTAIENLSFSINDCGVYGFLGPNGAGKSTTMNILTGCLAPTSGKVLVHGYDIQRQPRQAKAFIGYLPEIPPVYPDMTPREYLSFVAEAKGVPSKFRKAQIEAVMKRTWIMDMSNRLNRQLSKGYRQRVGIAQALLGDPPLVILDEPMVGLDPRQIREIRELIEDLGKDHTVLVSSHILPEIRSICQHILILAKGKLIASDTPENLERRYAGPYQIRLRVRASREETGDILSALACVSSFVIDDCENGSVCVTAQTQPDAAEAIFFAFSNRRRPILEMSHTMASLEDIFLKLTQEAQKGGGTV